MSKKILICGNYGATNLGDEAILAGTIIDFRKKYPKAKLSALSYDPPQTIKDHAIKANYFLPFGVRSFFRGIIKGELWRTLRAIKECDIFVLGGGGLFSNESWKAIAIWSLHTQAAYWFNKPVIMHAQTVDSIKSNFWRSITLKLFSKATSISVRDHQSQQILRSQGIDTVEVVKDPAWHLQPENKPTFPKRMIISLRPWKNQGPKIVEALAESLQSFSPEFEFTLIPFQRLSSDDLVILKLLSVQLDRRKIHHTIYQPKNYREALSAINSSAIIIAMRLHACIFAAICNKPFISICYLPKVSSFAQEVGMAGFSLALGEITPANISSKITEALKQTNSSLT